MKTVSFAIALLLINACNSPEMSTDPIAFLDSQIVLSGIQESKKLLSSSDEYTVSQSTFDNKSKTQNTGQVTERDYLQFAGNQAQQWNSSERNKIIKIVAEAEKLIKLKHLRFSLPDTIKLVKSTTKEEGEADGYTRGNFIVFQSNPSMHLFLHELFHVISRHNPTLRTELYSTLGFIEMPRMTYPASLVNRKITNPDAPFFEHYLPVKHQGQMKNVVFLTLAEREYTDGLFFSYLQKKLLVLQEIDQDGQEVELLDYDDVENLYEYIGKNTGYNIHPEEILAEHFTFLITDKDVKAPVFIDKIEAILK